MIGINRFDSAPALAGTWDATLLGHLSQINLSFLELLVNAAKGSAMLPTPLVSQLRLQWQQLPPLCLPRLAECPYLLVDAGFAVPGCWRILATSQVRETSSAACGYGFADALGAKLIRSMLVLAWHLARANPLAARVTLGMSAQCTTLIAARSLPELERLAETCPDWIRPRWEDRPEIWRQLLVAAQTGPEPRLRQLQLRGLQLLASSLAAGDGSR